MVKVLSPMRIARSRRTSFTNVEETQEIDFALGLRQGIQLYAAEFGALEFIATPTTTFVTHWAVMSLHARVGALEGGLDSFPADDSILNSEILAETSMNVMTQAAAVTVGGSAAAFQWAHPNVWNFDQITGGPLLVATNLTFRGITKSSAMVVNGGQVTLYYRYVALSDSELAQQFALRR